MIKQFTLLCLLALCGSVTVSAQSGCPAGQSELRLEVTPDFYWYEVSWRVKVVQTGEVLYSGNCQDEDPVTVTYCVPDSTCIEFQMLDDAGDGLQPTGFYKLYLNNVLIFENPSGIYGPSETTLFGCPPGSGCTSAIELQEGSYTTNESGTVTWYSFVPSANGIYQVSTCDTANHCPTKIWLYGEECGFIVPFETNQGTLFFSDGGCDNDSTLATANLFLAGGEKYYMRIGYANGSTCGETPINFSLSYVGAITGCTDPIACNYNPLASISADCIYPGNPDCPNAPDLMVVESAIKSSFQLSSINNNDPCFIEEGCLKGMGLRNLIRFDTHIKNVGDSDYYIGVTPSSPQTPSTQFVYDPCHNHWHYLGYAEYVVYDAQGNYVPVGSKTGFCVLDLECSDGGDGKYDCTNMGITAGCGDIYDSYLDCQWIDITGLPAGQYTFVMRVNWDQSPDKLGRVEKTYDNNWGQACFQLQYNANGSPDVELIEPCAPYVDCLGVPYGNAEIDCEGVCAGPALRGDRDKDLDRDLQDVRSYMTASLTDTAAVNTCRDLYADNHTDVYDAALLQECNLHNADPAYWGSRFACEFPTGKEQINDLVDFRLGFLDTLAKTLDIRIRNPFNKVVGYELQLAGIVIDSVENLSAEFQAEIMHTDNRIVALATTEAVMNKHSQPTNTLRVHYSTIAGSLTACIDSVIAVVNEKYNKSISSIASPSCASVAVSSSNDIPVVGAFAVSVVPNPALETTAVFFSNSRQLPTDITITDIQGSVVRTFKGVRDDNFTISRQEMASGVYLIHLRNENGLSVAKLIWQ